MQQAAGCEVMTATQERLRFSLSQKTIASDQKRQRAERLGRLHPIAHWMKPPTAAPAPIVPNIAAAEQYELSLDAIESGTRVLRASPGSVVMQKAGVSWSRWVGVRGVVLVSLGLAARGAMVAFAI